MKIVTAIDSFKGSMTSMEAGLAVTEGIHRVDSDVDVQIRPLDTRYLYAYPRTFYASISYKF